MIRVFTITSFLKYTLVLVCLFILTSQNAVAYQSAQIGTTLIEPEVSMLDDPFHTWTWSNISAITSETDFSFGNEFAVDHKGNIHVVWTDDTNYDGSGSDYDIFYKYWNITTNAWSLSKVVSDDAIETGIGNIAVDNNDIIHFTWIAADGPAVNQFAYHRTFNPTTQSWSTTDQLSVSGVSYSAEIAIDSKDNLHVVRETDDGVWYNFYNAKTGLWVATEKISIESTGISRDPSIALDTKDNLHVVWDDNTNIESSDGDYDIFYQKRDASTGLWSKLRVLSAESTGNSYQVDIVADNVDNIHIIWKDTTDYTGSSGLNADLFYLFIDNTNQRLYPIEAITDDNTGGIWGSDIQVDKYNNPHITWSDGSDINGKSRSTILYTFKTSIYDSFAERPKYQVDNTDYGSTYPKIIVRDAIYFIWEELAPGVDHDILFRYFSGSPQIPQLQEINQYPNANGIVDLRWTESHWANDYYIYKDTKPIMDTEGMTPLAIVESDYFIDNITESGRYYYALKSANSVAFSAISNYIYVDVLINSIPQVFTTVNTISGEETTSSFLPISFISVIFAIIISRFIIAKYSNKSV